MLDKQGAGQFEAYDEVNLRVFGSQAYVAIKSAQEKNNWKIASAQSAELLNVAAGDLTVSRLHEIWD